MRARGFKAFAALAVLMLGMGGPVNAYYPDDHIWDREYQSGVEWNYPVHKKPVPWVSSAAWRQYYPTAPAWWSTYAYNAWAPAGYTGWYDWRPGATYQQAASRDWQGWHGNWYGNWYGKYAAVPTAFIPVAPDWAAYRRTTANPWDNVAWNVAWWDGSYRPMTNAGYYKQVFNSSTNPFSDTRLNQELATAAAYGDIGRVRALVGSGADIHARDWEGYTPLTWAAQHGRAEVVDFLLSRYAQVNVRDRWGYTPLMWALQQGHTDIAAMLLAKGANPRVATPFGVTPEVLSVYAAGGRSRGLIADVLAGRRVDYSAYYKYGQSMAQATPQAAPMTPQQAAASLSASFLSPADATVKMVALAADFGNDMKAFMQASQAAGLGALNVQTLAEAEVAKNLSTLFTKFVKDRDFKQARNDLEAAKAAVKGATRFQRYLTSVDETLRQVGS